MTRGFRLQLPFLGLLGVLIPWTAFAAMEVDLYVHKDKFGKSLTLDIGDSECTNVPRLWSNLTMSVDTHGSCMQFYDQKSCKGRIAVIQPFHTVHQMDLSLINFHNAIQSASPCGPKVPSGRYVIQSAVDASMLTAQKLGNEFAKVNTLPPQAFIPKAQQWEISEKQQNEFDIMPRIHEMNYPVTYDGDSMKKGSFIRKVWKIESVGRGRYIIKSDWTQKCLYKTRVRTVEEHDCRAWSPNQEWVLRPLIAPTKPPPTKEPQLADDVNYQVPSKIVDKYLDEQKKLREKQKNKNKNKDSEEDDHVGAYLEPYRIRHRKKKPIKGQESSEESNDEEGDSDSRYRQTAQIAPPGPEIMYSRPSPIFPYTSQPRGRFPGKVVAYMDGISPIFEDAKVDDPVFPQFLLHAAAYDDGNEGPKYTVTRKPFQPMPIGHPNYVPDKKKYDGRVKDKNYKPPQPPKSEDAPKNEDESVEEPAQSEEQGSQEEGQEDVGKPVTQATGSPSNAKAKPSSTTNKKESTADENSEESQEDEGGESEEEDDGNDQNQKEDQKAEEEPLDLDDPAESVAGFMKILFQGINERLTKNEKKNPVAVNELLLK